MNELKLLRDVYTTGLALRLTAVVDDDFPEMMHNFDAALRAAKAAINTFELGFSELREANVKRSFVWGDGTEDSIREELLFRSNELGGECGEAQDAVKKYARFLKGMQGGVDQERSQEAIADELADTIICCDRVAEMIGIDLAEAVKNKFNKTSDKHGFSIKL